MKIKNQKLLRFFEISIVLIMVLSSVLLINFGIPRDSLLLNSQNIKTTQDITSQKQFLSEKNPIHFHQGTEVTIFKDFSNGRLNYTYWSSLHPSNKNQWNVAYRFNHFWLSHKYDGNLTEQTTNNMLLTPVYSSFQNSFFVNFLARAEQFDNIQMGLKVLLDNGTILKMGLLNQETDQVFIGNAALSYLLKINTTYNETIIYSNNQISVYINGSLIYSKSVSLTFSTIQFGLVSIGPDGSKVNVFYDYFFLSNNVSPRIPNQREEKLVYFDDLNEIWVNTNKYVWRVANDSYLLLKTGISLTNFSQVSPISIYAIDNGRNGERFLMKNNVYTKVKILNENKDNATIFLEKPLISNLNHTVFIRLNMTFYRDNGLVTVSRIIYNPNNYFLFSYAFQFQGITGGDQFNDYYYYPGANSIIPFPYKWWNDFSPLYMSPYNGMFYLTMFDNKTKDGVAIMADFLNYADHWTDIDYQSALEVHGVCKGQWNKIGMWLNTTGKLTYYIYFYQINDTTPYKPVEQIIDHIVQNKNNVPSKPQNISVSFTSNYHSFNLSWYPPIKTSGSQIIGYNIYRASFDSMSKDTSYSFIKIGFTQNTSFIDDNLVSDWTYLYAVTALNSNGESLSSDIVKATNYEYSSPSQPLDLIAYPGNGYVYLMWYHPTDDGGLTIQGYNIYRSTDVSLSNAVIIGNTTNTEFNDTSVINGQVYYYFVTAINSYGESPASQTAVTQPSQLLEPDSYEPDNDLFGAKLIHGNQTHSLYPLNDNDYMYFTITEKSKVIITVSQKITQYWDFRLFIDILNVEGNSIATFADYQNTSLIINREFRSGKYYIRIGPINDFGVILSYTISLLIITSPSEPQNLTGSLKNKQVLLKWEKPLTDGGSKIIKYNVYRASSLNGEYVLLGSVLNTTYVDEDIKAGKTYYYVVTAVNSIGESSFSNSFSITIPITKSIQTNNSKSNAPSLLYLTLTLIFSTMVLMEIKDRKKT